MYVQGNYPYCFNQVNCREYPSVKNDPSVFYVKDNSMIRQATIIKSSKSSLIAIKEIDKIIAEIEEIEKLRHLPIEEQFDRLDEAEQDEKDLDGDELLRKRRLEKDKTPDDNDHIEQNKSRYSVLEYNQASVDDNFMKKLNGNYKISECGDSLMKNLGATND